MSDQTLLKKKYRPEIDGLRAFAVFAVIINHFNKDFLPSGYLGVDIFFVISGYVITSSLEGREYRNFFHFIAAFYERRVKRLIPALVFFLCFTSIFVLFFNSDPRLSLRTGISSLFGLSNLYLLKQSADYFAQSSELNAFNHTWSLGVEEQFYFLFPFLIWFSGFGRQTKNGTRNFFISVLFLGICSLISFIYIYPLNQSAAYFLMPNRFWEMAAGCLLFIALNQHRIASLKLGKKSNFAILFGMIFVMFMPISSGLIATILIVLLTALIIAGLREKTPLFNVFTNKRIVYLGLISYPLYLWHWGILSLSKLTIGIHWWSIPFQFSLIYFLSTFSYKWIETPLRRKDWSLKKSFSIFKGLIILFISAIYLVLFDGPLKGKFYLGDLQVIPNENYYSLNKDLEYCNPKYHMYGNNGTLKSAKCFAVNEKNKKTLFFIGDSHNLAFLKGAEYIAEQTKSNMFFDRLLLQENRSQLKKGRRIISLVKSKESLAKEKEILFVSESEDIVFIINRFTIFLSANQKDFFEKYLISLDEFAKRLSKKNVSIVVTSPTPEFENATYRRCIGQNSQWFNSLNQIECSIPLNSLNDENGYYSKIIKKLKEIADKNENLYLFDSLSVMCPNSQCNYIVDDKLFYKDADHVSNYAARFLLAPKILDFLEKNKIIK